MVFFSLLIVNTLIRVSTLADIYDMMFDSVLTPVTFPFPSTLLVISVLEGWAGNQQRTFSQRGFLGREKAAEVLPPNERLSSSITEAAFRRQRPSQMDKCN